MPAEYQNDIAQFNPLLNGSRMTTIPPQVIQQQSPQAMGPQPIQSHGGLLSTLMQKMMGQAPSQILDKQQAFQAEQQKALNEHQINVLKSSYEQYNKLLSSQAVRDMAKAHDVNPEDIVAGSPLGQQLQKNSLQYESMKGNAMQAPGAQTSMNDRFVAEQQAQDVANRKNLGQVAGPNQISTIPGAGLKGDTTVKGPLVQQSVMQDRFGMVHPIQSATPGDVSSSGGPVPQDVKDASVQQPPAMPATPQSSVPSGNLNLGGMDMNSLMQRLSSQLKVPGGPMMSPSLQMNGMNTTPQVPQNTLGMGGQINPQMLMQLLNFQQ